MLRIGRFAGANAGGENGESLGIQRLQPPRSGILTARPTVSSIILLATDRLPSALWNCHIMISDFTYSAGVLSLMNLRGVQVDQGQSDLGLVRTNRDAGNCRKWIGCRVAWRRGRRFCLLLLHRQVPDQQGKLVNGIVRDVCRHWNFHNVT